MTKTLPDWFEDFEEVRQRAQTMIFMTRGIELQVQACDEVKDFLESLSDAKAAHIERRDEDSANVLLSIELSLRPVLEELRMWIALKRDDPEAAWDHLITAQDLTESALRVRAQVLPEVDNSGVQNYLARLQTIEEIVFPPQVFNSFGGVVRSRECSICGEEYDECEHLRGRAYRGRVCGVIIRDIDLQEVSIVDVPADKRARITHFSDQGGKRNRMTWRRKPEGSDSA